MMQRTAASSEAAILWLSAFDLDRREHLHAPLGHECEKLGDKVGQAYEALHLVLALHKPLHILVAAYLEGMSGKRVNER